MNAHVVYLINDIWPTSKKTHPYLRCNTHTQTNSTKLNQDKTIQFQFNFIGVENKVFHLDLFAFYYILVDLTNTVLFLGR